MLRKIGAFIFTLLLICGGVFYMMKFGGANKVKAPDNVEFTKSDSSGTVQTVTVDTPTITVTKHPNEETVKIGGTTWFISHADNFDGLDWVFTKPNNAEFRPKDLMELFPDFKIIQLSDETVELNTIPAELDGWTIKAKFTNPDCTVYSNPAVLHVVNYDVRYKDAMAIYRDFVADGRTNAELVSPAALKNPELGYTIADINGDGIEEMLICAADPQNGRYGGAVYDLLTIIEERDKKGNLEKSTVSRTICSSDTKRYYLLTDGNFYSIGSDEMGNTLCTIYSRSSLGLQAVESFWAVTDSCTPYYYHGYGEVGEGDYKLIESSEFYSLVSDAESRINYLYPAGYIKGYL